MFRRSQFDENAGRKNSCTHSISIRWRRVATITLRPLHPWEKTPIPLKREAGWTTQPFWKLWRRKISLVPTKLVFIVWPRGKFVYWYGPSTQKTAHHWHAEKHRCIQLRFVWIRDGISTEGTWIDSKELAAPQREPEWQRSHGSLAH